MPATESRNAVRSRPSWTAESTARDTVNSEVLPTLSQNFCHKTWRSVTGDRPRIQKRRPSRLING